MRLHSLLSFLLIGLFSQVAWSSGFSFLPGSPDITLGKASTPYDNGKPLPPRYHVTVHEGQSFTLSAQSVAISRPRGASEDSPPKPFKAQASTWIFDDQHLQLAAPVHEAKEHSNQIRLTARKAGKTRVRFIGLVGGYEKKFDVCLTVIATRPRSPATTETESADK